MSRNTRQYTFFDKLIQHADTALRTLTPGAAQSYHPSPAEQRPAKEMSDTEMILAYGLIRINHTGTVCSQALYHGQVMTAYIPEVREAMEKATQEEVDHLVWCEDRLKELNGRTIFLNPIFYGLSFGIGAAAGKISDKVSLGFVAATEDQVCKHLTSHMSSLPVQDERSKAVLLQMLEDEAKHATNAINAGGYRFPLPVKLAMSGVSKIMTKSVYKI